MEGKSLDREELYKLVWSEPTTKVAARLGISDVGLTKVCKRHRIPKPGRGYWQLKEAGKRVKQPKLPMLKPGEEGLAVVRFRHRERSLMEVEESVGPVADQKRYEADPKHRITVPKQLRQPHPLVQETRNHLKEIKQGRWHRPGRFRRLNLSVDDRSFSRALRIMQALIRALEARGYTVSVPDASSSRTVVSVFGEEVEIRLWERSKKVERPQEDRLSMFSNSYDLVPTGRLTLEICEWCARRKSWTDGKRQRIEDRLNRFVVALVETAVTKRQWRKDREEQRRRWEEESRRRLEEQSRVQRLENALAQWRRAEDLRAFIAAARQHTVAGSNGSSANVDEWIEWAATYADRIDPLIGDPRFL